MVIGIDTNKSFIYEGDGTYGYPIWPSPVISIATFVNSEESYTNIPNSPYMSDASYVFREDSFDPLSRIRRGRIYNSPTNGSKNPYWYVESHPAITNKGAVEIDEQKQLYSFYRSSLVNIIKETGKFPMVALGTKEQHTVWQIVGVEKIYTGEDLVTLKAIQNFGIVPEVDEDELPEINRSKVLETISKLVDTAYRLGPESIVDRCRDTASAILGGYCHHIDEKAHTEDLGYSIKCLESEEKGRKKVIVINAANIIARMHPRVKPNEQTKRDLRPVSEHDAELCLHCVSSILYELGYAT